MSGAGQGTRLRSETQAAPAGGGPGAGGEGRARRGRGIWIGAGAVLLALAVAVWLVRSRSGQGSAAGGRPGEAQGQRAVPATVVAAARRDVPIWLEGLGNAVANRTVTVRSQVDGRLDAVLFREGQAVRQGEALAQVDPRSFQAQLLQAQGALARDEAQLRNAQINVARDRELVAQKLVAQQQLDTDLATAGQLEGSVQIDRAAIESARLNVEYARIVSPVDGVTGIRGVDPGNVVHASDPNGIVVVTQLDPIAVVFTLPQDQLGPVAEQQARGPLTVEAYARDGSTLLGTGKLEVIDNQINQTTSTLRLKAIFPNPRHALWPNQFVNVRLRLETRRDALVVPASAVQRGPNGTFVYLVGADDTATMRPISIAITQGDLALVAKGVDAGERVVVEGQSQLRPGAKVAPRAAGGGAPPAGVPAAALPAAAPAEAADGGAPRGSGAAAR
ncbi:MAG TPA: efflux RND transporter periplasmic adaptor subunit [Anaeromyxobacteraceae bacterium]|nr:efflux RND transporter periplasmic adaptor subunit [Anaeromyxobacteraceae bacterium]